MKWDYSTESDAVGGGGPSQASPSTDPSVQKVWKKMIRIPSMDQQCTYKVQGIKRNNQITPQSAQPVARKISLFDDWFLNKKLR